MALAAINAFSQFGNIAGSYVWNLEADGFRKSYGIVTAMFGVTIAGCFVFKMSLMQLNKKLEAEEMAELDAGEDGPGAHAAATATESKTSDEALNMRKGFRYLV